MDLFTKEHLTELAQTRGTTCISVFMPTFHVESELAQNPIRLKNLVKRIRQELKDVGTREPEIDKMLEPVQNLFGQSDFWLHQSDGLAIFATPQSMRVFRLPLSLPELVTVGQRFHLKPLFPLIATNNRFYVLALSQHSVRLYQGTHHSLSEVESRDIPKDISEALPFEVVEGTTRLRVRQIAGRGNEPSFHGHGGDAEDEKHEPNDHIKRFFHEVAQGLTETLKDETAPVVLAGVEYYLPLFREANTYAHLVEDAIVAGNPESVKPQQLHERAWEIVQPIFQAAQEKSIQTYRRLRSTDGRLASAELKEIIPAAVFSRVDTVFVPIGRHRWGYYDVDDNTVEIHDEKQTGDEDLLDLAAVHVFMHGGTVHALRPENMPDQHPLAAVFRYPADVLAEER